MNTEQLPQSDDEQVPLSRPNLKKRLITETSFSKYLTMALFIILPFLGFWLGYAYQDSKLANIEARDNFSKDNQPLVSDTDTNSKPIDNTISEPVLKQGNSVVVNDPKQNTESPPQVSCCQIGDIRESIRENGSVPLIIQFDIEFTPEGYLSEEETKKQRENITTTQQTLIKQMEGEGFSVIATYDTLPSMSARVDGESFERLLTLPVIKSVEEDIPDFAN